MVIESLLASSGSAPAALPRSWFLCFYCISLFFCFFVFGVRTERGAVQQLRVVQCRFFCPASLSGSMSLMLNLISTAFVLALLADEDREDWETDFFPGTQHTNSTPQYDLDAQYDS